MFIKLIRSDQISALIHTLILTRVLVSFIDLILIKSCYQFFTVANLLIHS